MGGDRRSRIYFSSAILLTFIGIFRLGSGYGVDSPQNFQATVPKRTTPGTRLPSVNYAGIYDFVVVGGGTAGCAVASRLSENGKHSVLLLEAGGMPDPDLDVPALMIKHYGNPEYTLIHESVRQENASLRHGGIVRYMRGRTLGGSSSVNFMIFNRGNPHDFDNWANITGDDSWSYRNMLKYFKKSEDYLVEGSPPANQDQHASGGPIGVSIPTFAPGVDVWLAAGRSLGYPTVNPNAPQQISFAVNEFARRKGRRVSSYTGYIKPHMNSRKNLKVILNADVSQIQFAGKKAVGVWYTKNSTGNGNSQRQFVKARKEIILSGGVIGSPVILLKSGIGPRAELEKYRIPAVKYLPVGENLQDHNFLKHDFLINNKSMAFDADRDLTQENWKLYEETGEGPYSSSYGYDGQAFLASSLQQKCKHADWPDTQFMAVMGVIPGGIPPIYDIRPEPGEAPISVSILASRPKSRGTVKLNPENLNGMPLIDFQYYADPYDTEVMLDGVKTLLRVFDETPEYRKLGARLPREPFSGCRNLTFRSDEYWKCYIRQVSISGMHGSSTCTMGKGPYDRNAVVDTKLRVIGIDGLRVVDASIMPQVTNANLHAAVYGIAEKASDMILEVWK